MSILLSERGLWGDGGVTATMPVAVALIGVARVLHEHVGEIDDQLARSPIADAYALGCSQPIKDRKTGPEQRRTQSGGGIRGVTVADQEIAAGCRTLEVVEIPHDDLRSRNGGQRGRRI